MKEKERRLGVGGVLLRFSFLRAAIRCQLISTTYASLSRRDMLDSSEEIHRILKLLAVLVIMCYDMIVVKNPIDMYL